MDTIWEIVRRSPYKCTEIDGRPVNIKHTHSGIWSREELIQEVVSLTGDVIYNHNQNHKTYKFPYRFGKPEFSKAIVVLRGLRCLEQRLIERVTEKMNGVKNQQCSICQNPLWCRYTSESFAPLFKHSYTENNSTFVIMYHIPCIIQWLWISHSFTDPVTRKEYSTSEIQYIDRIADIYGLAKDRALAEIRDDPETKRHRKESH